MALGHDAVPRRAGGAAVRCIHARVVCELRGRLAAFLEAASGSLREAMAHRHARAAGGVDVDGSGPNGERQHDAEDVGLACQLLPPTLSPTRRLLAAERDARAKMSFTEPAIGASSKYVLEGVEQKQADAEIRELMTEHWPCLTEIHT